MAKFFLHNGAVGLSRSAATDIFIPAGATNLTAFDETTNAQVLADFDASCGRFAFSGATLTRDGIAVAFAADSQTKQDKDAFAGNLDTAVTRLGQIVTQAGAGLTNTQRDTAIGDLATILRRTLRRLAQIQRES